MTNDRNETKPRRPQIKTYARLWKSVWLASAIIVAMAIALACQEQEPSGQQGTINLIRDCNKKMRISLIVQRGIDTAERGNEIVQAYQEVTHLDCGPDTWSAKISSTPQSCHHAEWGNGTTVPESLALSGDSDSDGLTRDTIGNILVQFSEPHTGSRFTAKCWMYDAHENKWDRSVD